VDVAHEVAFAIVGHAVAQDQVVHATADIDRIDLQETVVFKCSGDIRSGLIEKQGPLHKPAGCFTGNLEGRTQADSVRLGSIKQAQDVRIGRTKGLAFEGRDTARSALHVGNAITS